MDTLTLPSRRAFLKGAPLAVAALAIAPPALAAVPAQPTVLEAIAAHRAAFRHIRRGDRLIDRLQSLPGRPPYPKVQTGEVVLAGSERSPIYATTHEEIEARAATWIDRASLFGGAPRAAPYRAQFDGFHRALTRMIRARTRFDRASGLVAALADRKAAFDAEGIALARLVLARPTTPAEAEAKRRYFKSNPAIHEWWEAPEVVSLVRDMSCEVQAMADTRRAQFCPGSLDPAPRSARRGRQMAGLPGDPRSP